MAMDWQSPNPHKASTSSTRRMVLRARDNRGANLLSVIMNHFLLLSYPLVVGGMWLLGGHLQRKKRPDLLLLVVVLWVSVVFVAFYA